MNFPLVPVPIWLVSWLPTVFASSQNSMIALLGGILGLISGFGRILPPLVDGERSEVNKQFMIQGLAMLACSVLFFIFGGYLLLLLIAILTVVAVTWLLKRSRNILQ
jgi:hypothetical protein